MTPDGLGDDPAGRLQVGQGQAGDRLVAERLEPLGWQFQLAADRLLPSRWPPGCRTAGRAGG